MPLKSLDDLFMHFLRDIYYAERQILKALPRMARKADSDQLRDAFESHQAETELHVANLEKVFELLEVRARGVTCEAIDGILEEGKEIMAEAEAPDALDAGMIAAAQAVEHYEITRYGTLIAWAKCAPAASSCASVEASYHPMHHLRSESHSAPARSHRSASP